MMARTGTLITVAAFAATLMIWMTGCASLVGPKDLADPDPVVDGYSRPDSTQIGGQWPAGQMSQTVTTHTSRGQGRDLHPEIYGTGTDAWLYFASDREGDGYNIYRKQPNGKAMSRVTSMTGDEYWPRVSPDGQYLAFGSNKSGNWDICVMSLADLSVPPAIITSGSKSNDIHPSWANDSATLYYAGWSDTLEEYILKYASLGKMDQGKMMAPSGDSGASAMSHNMGGGGAISFAELPGGAPMAMDDEPACSGGFLMVMSQGNLLTNQGELVTGIHAQARPDPDGTETDMLVYQSARGSGDRWFGLKTFNLATGIVTILPTTEGFGAIQPRWSPDGNLICFTTVAKDRASKKHERFSNGDGFGLTRIDGQSVSDLRNPIPDAHSTVSDPTWVRYMGETRLFFTVASGNSEFIASVKLGN